MTYSVYETRDIWGGTVQTETVKEHLTENEAITLTARLNAHGHHAWYRHN